MRSFKSRAAEITAHDACAEYETSHYDFDRENGNGSMKMIGRSGGVGVMGERKPYVINGYKNAKPTII